jgi:hypothetical protein
LTISQQFLGFKKLQFVGGIWIFNDRFQPLPEAGATQERTLEAVG